MATQLYVRLCAFTHWRTDKIVELISVEAKLEFSAKLVMQAMSYQRFADRVWAAVKITSDEPGKELRYEDSLLFETVIEAGIGILACCKRQGGAYEVYPIHWPRLNKLDPVAREEFIEHYREELEESKVVEDESNRFRKPQFR